jgi:hypothetical protein
MYAKGACEPLATLGPGVVDPFQTRWYKADAFVASVPASMPPAFLRVLGGVATRTSLTELGPPDGGSRVEE